MSFDLCIVWQKYKSIEEFQLRKQQGGGLPLRFKFGEHPFSHFGNKILLGVFRLPQEDHYSIVNNIQAIKWRDDRSIGNLLQCGVITFSYIVFIIGTWLNIKHWTLNIEYYILNIEYWTLKIGHWILDGSANRLRSFKCSGRYHVLFSAR